MSLHRFTLSAACLFTSLTLSAAARADTYNLFNVYGTGNGNSGSIGITDAGLDVVRTPLNYLTFNGVTGTQTSSAIPPSLTFDNGTSCTVANNGAFTAIFGAVCNNGRVAFLASTSTLRQGVFIGLDSLNDLLYNGLSGNLKLNAMGDIAFDTFSTSSSMTDDNYFAYDVTSRIAPEPSSLLLLGSGACSLLGLYRRRWLKA